MTMRTVPVPGSEIVYPSSDGQPMAENTQQFQWIVTIKGNLDGAYRHDPDVFVAGDLLWYPVQGQPAMRRAPDIFVAFGRPKGHRSSYLQWEEGGVAPQVVWEIRSPGNTDDEMVEKFIFYEHYGVEEYYVYDPKWIECLGWRRSAAGRLEPIPQMHNWVSPLLGIRFDLSGPALKLFHSNGKPFLTFEEIMAAQEEAEQRAELERQARLQAEQRAEQERLARERMAARLRALGIDPNES